MNFLESLVSEWYEYNGYFVRTNPRARKRKRGGWDIELDVLAYLPSEQKLLHIETSSDANSWSERKERFTKKKFILSIGEYGKLIGHKIKKIDKIAIVGWTRSTNVYLNWGNDIQVLLIPIFLAQITKKLKSIDPMHEAVPESYPLLRAMQMALAFQNKA